MTNNRNANEIEESKKVVEKENIISKNLKNRQRILISLKFGIQLIEKIHEYYGHIGINNLSEKLRPYIFFLSLWIKLFISFVVYIKYK